MIDGAAAGLPPRVAALASVLAEEAPIPEILSALEASIGWRPPTLALAWATVDLDRAAAELAEVGLGPFTPAPSDDHLGAAARRAPGLVLLEPSTEGPLAASLARRDEGPCGLYLGLDDGGWSEVAETGLSASGPGPLGEQRLVERRPIRGPHILLVRLPSSR